MGKGWIKLHRQSVDNSLYSSEPFDKWHAWIDLLLLVNHEEKQFISKGQLVNLEAGQTVTSDRILADRWKWSRDKVRRYLRLLVDTGMCTINRSTNGTTITVVNWDKYQNGTTTGKTTDDTTDKTADNTTDDTLTRMNKNDKEHKNARARARRESDHDRVFAEFLELVAEKEREEQERKNDSEGVRRDPENIERPLQAL